MAQGNSWLLDALAEEWSLPSDTDSTVQYVLHLLLSFSFNSSKTLNQSCRYGGYYTTLFEPGLRIVSVNSNYCLNGNLWLLINSTDPAGELQWLVNVLQVSVFVFA